MATVWWRIFHLYSNLDTWYISSNENSEDMICLEKCLALQYKMRTRFVLPSLKQNDQVEKMTKSRKVSSSQDIFSSDSDLQCCSLSVWPFDTLEQGENVMKILVEQERRLELSKATRSNLLINKASNYDVLKQ